MELFLPSLAVIFFVTIVLFMWLPKLTPIIMASLALAMLVVGVYHHWQMFSTEYRLSTWQEQLKLFAPGIFIGVTLLIIIYTILAVFTGGEVPVPSMPNISMPAIATNLVENVKNAVAEAAGAVNEAANATANAVANAVPGMAENEGAKKNNAGAPNNKRGNNVSRSFLEVI